MARLTEQIKEVMVLNFLKVCYQEKANMDTARQFLRLVREVDAISSRDDKGRFIKKNE